MATPNQETLAMLRVVYLDQFADQTHDFLDWLYRLRNSIINKESLDAVRTNAAVSAQKAVIYRSTARVCFTDDQTMRNLTSNIMQTMIDLADQLDDTYPLAEALLVVRGIIDDLTNLRLTAKTKR